VTAEAAVAALLNVRSSLEKTQRAEQPSPGVVARLDVTHKQCVRRCAPYPRFVVEIVRAIEVSTATPSTVADPERFVPICHHFSSATARAAPGAPCANEPWSCSRARAESRERCGSPRLNPYRMRFDACVTLRARTSVGR
jgi:hypothetical protein